jgi:hypothetical protein
MTTTPSLDHLSLRSPDALLASIPYLLGFHPQHSAVVVWLAARRIVLTQRLDLPTRSDQLEAWHAAVWGHAAVAVADSLVLVLVTPDSSDEPLAIADAIARRADVEEIEVRDMLRLDGNRWWSLLCPDPECCPPDGRVIDEGVRDEVAAEFTGLGIAPLTDRDQLVRTLRPDEVGAFAVTTVLDRTPEPSDREAWRDECIAHVLRMCSVRHDGRPSAHESALAVSGLADVRVRDTVLWEVARWNADDLEVAYARLCALTIVAPSGLVAPVATCAAVVSWLLGDGARAVVAIERALDDEPRYSLGGLVAASLAGGLPPGTWRDAMHDLTRDACRHGVS